MPKDEFDQDDPMDLHGVALPGDTREAMAECFIEEFALMGFSEEQILRLFEHPFYAATHAIRVEQGEQYVRDLIRRVRDRWRPDASHGGGPESPYLTLTPIPSPGGRGGGEQGRKST